MAELPFEGYEIIYLFTLSECVGQGYLLARSLAGSPFCFFSSLATRLLLRLLESPPQWDRSKPKAVSTALFTPLSPSLIPTLTWSLNQTSRLHERPFALRSPPAISRNG